MNISFREDVHERGASEASYVKLEIRWRLESLLYWARCQVISTRMEISFFTATRSHVQTQPASFEM
jgi:hypothetical protein